MAHKPKRVSTRWYKKSHRRHPVEALADPAFELFYETGGVTALLAFCDALAELPTGSVREDAIRNEPFEKKLREMIARPDREDVQLFFRWGGYGVMPDTSEAESALEAALSLRAAEQWFLENEYVYDSDPYQTVPPRDGWLRFRWEEDQDYDPADYDSPGMPDIAFGCQLQRWEQEPRTLAGASWRWSTMEGLWGITFGPPHDNPFADPYHRVVQAELALEAMPLVVPRTTDVHTVFNALLLTDVMVRGAGEKEEDFDALRSIVGQWTDDWRAQAYEWAVREHLHASDNDDVARVPCPPFLEALRPDYGRTT